MWKMRNFIKLNEMQNFEATFNLGKFTLSTAIRYLNLKNSPNTNEKEPFCHEK